MNFYPSIDDFKKLHKQYGRGYLSFKINTSNLDPISLFKRLRNGEKSFLLESVEHGKGLGRYSHIGRNPMVEIICKKNIVKVFRNNQEENFLDNPLTVIKNILGQYEMCINKSVERFWGGAVGYIGYDTAKYAYKIFSDHADTINTSDSHLIIPREIITYDNQTKEIRITVHVEDIEHAEQAYEACIQNILSILNEINQDNVKTNITEHYFMDNHFSSNETLESFSKKVNKIKDHILKGDIFQCVISQRLSVNTNLDPFAAYESLRDINPSQYMFFLDFVDYQVLGSSPEMLAKHTKESIMTCPIAGTRPRGKNDAEDQYLMKDLLSDEKELAEHKMLVDLARNDIGRVAEFGSVNLDAYMDIKLYSHVMHIVSLVSGKPREDVHPLDTLISCMPAGTLSGAPKKRAMEILNDLETNKRGIYGGAVGWFGFDNTMDTCIAIRTIVFKNQTAYIQAGAGIVHDSVPENEYDETMRKANGQLSALKHACQEVS